MAAGCWWSILRTGSTKPLGRSWMHCWSVLAIALPARRSRSCGWPMSSLTVLGAGAWGTALAIQAARAGNDVVLLARSGADAMVATRESPRLPGHRLPDTVCVTGDRDALSGTIVAAVPTQSLRTALTGVCGVYELVICAKGIEAVTLRLPLEIAAEVCPGAATCVLTGPNFAHEIASGQ